MGFPNRNITLTKKALATLSNAQKPFCPCAANENLAGSLGTQAGKVERFGTTTGRDGHRFLQKKFSFDDAGFFHCKFTRLEP